MPGKGGRKQIAEDAGMLSDVKVVELGSFISAPFCAKLLADLGAEVLKVEEPFRGDISRAHGPFPNDEPHPEKSGLFLYLNSNKKGITLNVKEPLGRQIFKELLRDADILIENNPPGMMKGLGLDYAGLKEELPKLIVVSITPYGQTGPYADYKGYALNVSAVSGLGMGQGDPDREPLDHPMSCADYVGAQVAANGAMIALFDRDRTGRGQLCDVSSVQAVLSYLGTGMIGHFYKVTHDTVRRTGTHGLRMLYPYVILPCKDGHFCVFTINFAHWISLMELLGNPEWAKDPRFNPPPEQGVYALAPYIDELDELLASELKKYTKAELHEKCMDKGLPFVPVVSIDDWVNSEQAKFRNEVVELEHPVAGKLRYPGAPAQVSPAPWKLERPAPLLGQHNSEVYCDKLGYSRADLVELRHAALI